jgi:hypothetical protein
VHWMTGGDWPIDRGPFGLTAFSTVRSDFRIGCSTETDACLETLRTPCFGDRVAAGPNRNLRESTAALREVCFTPGSTLCCARCYEIGVRHSASSRNSHLPIADDERPNCRAASVKPRTSAARTKAERTETVQTTHPDLQASHSRRRRLHAAGLVPTPYRNRRQRWA